VHRTEHSSLQFGRHIHRLALPGGDRSYAGPSLTENRHEHGAYATGMRREELDNFTVIGCRARRAEADQADRVRNAPATTGRRH
jgi:hypothetical protein